MDIKSWFAFLKRRATKKEEVQNNQDLATTM